MKSFAKSLKKYPDLYHLSGVSKELINEAEETLSVSFSKDYKEYLEEYGIASVAGHEFTGICKSARLNVVNSTLSNRQSIPEASSWYVVEETNIDGILIWQATSGEVYLTAPGEKTKKIFDSLIEYMENNHLE